MDHKERAKEYLAKAEECESLAERMDEDHLRQSYLRLARSWRDLASSLGDPSDRFR